MQSHQKPKLDLWLVILFYYVVTSIGALLLGSLQPALGLPTVVLQLTQFAPAIGVLAILPLCSLAKMPALTLDLRLRPHQPRMLIVAIALGASIFLASWLWYSVSGHPVAYTSPSSLTHPFWLIAIAQFIGAAGEEVGWRCFLQPTLQRRLGVLPASILVGILWGVWHIGVFAEGLAYALLFILLAVSLSVILGELLREARGGRLLLSTLFHTLINLGLLVWFNEEDGSLLAIGSLAMSGAIVAMIVVLLGRVSRTGLHEGHISLRR